MKNKKTLFVHRKISKLTNPIIITAAIFFLVLGFFLWMSYPFSHDTFFYLTLIPTVALTFYTLFFIFNLTTGYLTKNKKINTILINIFYLSFLGLLSYSYISAAIHLRPAKKISCSFNIADFRKEIKNKFQADTVVINSAVIQEEPYFPQIRCPFIFIDNGITNTLNFKTLDCDSIKRFENYSEIKDALRREGQFIADRLFRHCNMQDFDKILIQFCKLDTMKNRDCYSFLVGYNDNDEYDGEKEINSEIEEYYE